MGIEMHVYAYPPFPSLLPSRATRSTALTTAQAPQLDINTIAAGGGSKLRFSSGIFLVGPESVGAHPGPVCYRKARNDDIVSILMHVFTPPVGNWKNIELEEKSL